MKFTKDWLDVHLKTNKSKFDVLFKSICSQQISVSAAMSIYKNSKNIIGPINFKNFNTRKKIRAINKIIIKSL